MERVFTTGDLNNQEQDFFFKQIDGIFSRLDLPKEASLLDIGAGQGRVMPVQQIYFTHIDVCEKFPKFIKVLKEKKAKEPDSKLRKI